MRPTRQIKIINSHLEGFVNLRERIGFILDHINKVISKGESWIQGNDEVGTFSQFNQFLDFEMTTCLKQLCVVTENEDIFQICDPSVRDQSSSTDVNSRMSNNDQHIQLYKENYLALNTQYEQLKNSSEILTQKFMSLQEKLRVQSKLVKSIYKNQSNADIKNESRFDTVMTELHTASDFIQSQSEIFSAKIKRCEEKCSLDVNEKANNTELRLKEIVLKQLVEHEDLNNKKLNEINVEMKRDKECFSSKLNDLQKELNQIPIRMDKLEIKVGNIPPSTSANEPLAEVIERLLPQAVNKTKLFTGRCETQLTECKRKNIKFEFSKCMKNPGHTNFIPIDQFTINHLPEGHRKMELYELIEVTADLTVRVDVKINSPQKPKFWPNLRTKSPFYGMERKKLLRTGSGMVCGLIKFTDGINHYGNKEVNKITECWCKSCQSSDKASNIWWEIDVLTAPQVVFDNTEASHTSLKLFYNSEDSPEVSVDHVRFVDINVDRDWSMLKFVTCDTDLGKKLNKLWKCYNDLLRKVWKEYEESRDVVKLTFIVSHPHGCSKHVSVGQWVDKHKVSKYVKQFTYTVSTCPGSSGARVHCVGYYASHLVHSGCLNSGLNYSGVS